MLIVFGMVWHYEALFCKGNVTKNLWQCKLFKEEFCFDCRLWWLITINREIFKIRFDCVSQLTVHRYDWLRSIQLTGVLRTKSWLTKIVRQSLDKHNSLLVWRMLVDHIDIDQSLSINMIDSQLINQINFWSEEHQLPCYKRFSNLEWHDVTFGILFCKE